MTTETDIPNPPDRAAWSSRIGAILHKTGAKPGTPGTLGRLVALGEAIADGQPLPDGAGEAIALCSAWLHNNMGLISDLAKIYKDAMGFAPGPSQLVMAMQEFAAGARTRDAVVTTFDCRLGLEPHTEPAGKLLYSLVSPLRADGSPKDGPVIVCLEVRRKEIRLVTKDPLTDEQHAAITGACVEFDLAVEMRSRQGKHPGDTVAT